MAVIGWWAVDQTIVDNDDAGSLNHMYTPLHEDALSLMQCNLSDAELWNQATVLLLNLRNRYFLKKP